MNYPQPRIKLFRKTDLLLDLVRGIKSHSANWGYLKRQFSESHPNGANLDQAVQIYAQLHVRHYLDMFSEIKNQSQPDEVRVNPFEEMIDEEYKIVRKIEGMVAQEEGRQVRKIEMPTRFTKGKFTFHFEGQYWYAWCKGKEYSRIGDIVLLGDLPVAIDVRTGAKGMRGRFQQENLVKVQTTLQELFDTEDVGYLVVGPKDCYPKDVPSPVYENFLKQGGTKTNFCGRLLWKEKVRAVLNP